MSDRSSGIQRSVTVPTGGTGHTSLIVPATYVCQLSRAILFDTARSFVRPTPRNKAVFHDLILRLQNSGTLNHLLIAGHTDSVGSEDDNRPLSEWRAQNVQAVLQGNTDPWETFFSTTGQGGERWGTPELTMMVVETGEADPGNPTAVTQAVDRYRGRESANVTARADLFRCYFERLLGGSAVPPIQTTTPAVLACGEEQLLRGNRLSPSRDTSLPPIEGDFEPNRRVEFFFFDGSHATIACSEYPRWTVTCSLIPATPTITATIASVETIRKNRTANIQITVYPSPLPFNTSITLRLDTTIGTGEARFTSTNSETMAITQTGTVTVRGIAASSAVDNIRLTATITGQTSILAQEDFTVVDAISIFLRFEVWDLTTHTFETLPAGIDVDIMDYEQVLSNDRLLTQQTYGQGRVFFNASSLRDPDEPEPDIFFLVHTNGRSHAHHTLPDEWSTKGWEAVDGTPGFHPSFTGGQIGSPNNPTVFRVGLDFHARVQYRVDGGPRAGSAQLVVAGVNSDDPAPPGVLVNLMQEQIGRDTVLLVLRTDENGEVDGVSFEAEPGNKFYLRVIFEIEDSDINFKRARFSEVPFVPPIIDIVTPAGPTLYWDSSDSDADNEDFPSHRRTSIGVFGSPKPFRCTLDDRNVALHILKVLRELAVFLFEITQGDWKGVEVAVTPSAPVTAFSWPVGRIQLKFPSDRWDRGTLIHEMSHQIMWEEVNSSAAGILYKIILGDLVLYHQSNLLANPSQALIEGWAEFIEAIFEGVGTPPYQVLNLVEPGLIPGSRQPVPGGLGPPPLNRGESVEGAFANGLWAIFQNHVVAAGGAHVPESVNGDIMTTTAYLSNTAVWDRFLSMIWRPLKDLKPMSTPTSTAMIEKIKSRNSAVWHRLQPELQAFNMAMHAPTITSIWPDWGPIAGGQNIAITGTNFIARTTVTTGATLETRVEFGGVAATSVTVNGSGDLVAVPPPQVVSGPVDVVVTTPAGSATRTSGFIYIDEPLNIINVTPTNVSTRGGDPIRIRGMGFLPGAIVSLSGNPVDDLFVDIQSPGIIVVQTPPASAASSVSVAVQNPDASYAVWSGQLIYIAPPQISYISPPSGSSFGGTRVDIYGSNFHRQIVVFFDQATLAQVNFVDSGHIWFHTPPGSPGPVEGEVQNPDEQSDDFEFYYE